MYDEIDFIFLYGAQRAPCYPAPEVRYVTLIYGALGCGSCGLEVTYNANRQLSSVVAVRVQSMASEKSARHV